MVVKLYRVIVQTSNNISVWGRHRRLGLVVFPKKVSKNYSIAVYIGADNPLRFEAPIFILDIFICFTIHR